MIPHVIYHFCRYKRKIQELLEDDEDRMARRLLEEGEPLSDPATALPASSP